jgi:hypothetical protein
MATVKVVDQITRAQTILQDTTGVRWPVTELQNWLNDAYREITQMRPDANASTGTYTCTAGTRQVLTSGFPSALRLMDVVRNMAASSNKRAIRLVDRHILDDQRRGWHTEAETVNIEHYMFDPRLPKEFLVYPPASTSAQLEVVYASVPTGHTLSEAQLANPATSEVIRIDDSYANAILDYMLYRAYTKDAEYAANAQRAVGHYQAMQASLGVKTGSDQASQPGAV